MVAKFQEEEALVWLHIVKDKSIISYCLLDWNVRKVVASNKFSIRVIQNKCHDCLISSSG